MNPKKCTIGTESLEGKVWPSDFPLFCVCCTFGIPRMKDVVFEVNFVGQICLEGIFCFEPC